MQDSGATALVTISARDSVSVSAEAEHEARRFIRSPMATNILISRAKDLKTKIPPDAMRPFGRFIMVYILTGSGQLSYDQHRHKLIWDKLWPARWPRPKSTRPADIAAGTHFRAQGETVTIFRFLAQYGRQLSGPGS